jgi:hypothetical protein
METYDSARPERAQIEDSGFLDVRGFDGSVVPHDASNHDKKFEWARDTVESKVHEY